MDSGKNRSLAAAGLLALFGTGFVLCGVFLGLREILFPLAAFAGIAAYSFVARWLARQKHLSGLIYFLERIRRAIAYQGDLEPRQYR